MLGPLANADHDEPGIESLVVEFGDFGAKTFQQMIRDRLTFNDLPHWRGSSSFFCFQRLPANRLSDDGSFFLYYLFIFAAIIRAATKSLCRAHARQPRSALARSHALSQTMDRIRLSLRRMPDLDGCCAIPLNPVL